MLCLNRKIGQGIQVNDDVTITVLEIRRSAVRLGVTYGDKSRVLRHEVYLKVQSGNEQAALGAQDVAHLLEKVIQKKPFTSPSFWSSQTQEEENLQSSKTPEDFENSFSKSKTS